MKIYSRERWGARQGRSGMAQQASPTEAFIHYTDGAASTIASTDRFVEQAAAMRGIQGFHMDGRGWSDIAYHFALLSLLQLG